MDVLESRQRGRLQRVAEAVGERLGGGVAQPQLWVVCGYVVGDRLEQVGLAGPDRPVEEKRVVGVGRQFGHDQRGSVGEAVAAGDHELVEAAGPGSAGGRRRSGLPGRSSGRPAPAAALRRRRRAPAARLAAAAGRRRGGRRERRAESAADPFDGLGGALEVEGAVLERRRPQVGEPDPVDVLGNEAGQAALDVGPQLIEIVSGQCVQPPSRWAVCGVGSSRAELYGWHSADLQRRAILTAHCGAVSRRWRALDGQVANRAEKKRGQRLYCLLLRSCLGTILERLERGPPNIFL